MPDTSRDFADQWIGIAELLDLMDALDRADPDCPEARLATLRAVLGWMTDRRMLSLPMRAVNREYWRAQYAAANPCRLSDPREDHPETQQGKGNPDLSAPEGNRPEPGPTVVAAEDPGAAPVASRAEVPVAAGTDRPAAARPAPIAGSPWSEDEIATARRMLAEGFSGSAIAAELGRPLPATYQKIRSLRRAPGKPGRPRKTAVTIPAGPRAAPVRKPAEPVAQGGQGPDSARVTPAPETAPAAPVNGQRVSPAPGVSPAVDAGAAGPDTAPPVQASLQQRISPPPAATDPDRPLWWREIEILLNALGYKGGWNAADDLALAEGLAKGVPLPILADQIGQEPAACRARFIALTPDGVTIEGQSHLLQVLRARAGAV